MVEEIIVLRSRQAQTRKHSELSKQRAATVATNSAQFSCHAPTGRPQMTWVGMGTDMDKTWEDLSVGDRVDVIGTH